MSLEKEHNASNEPFIPEGLEYREEYWYDALAKIEAHERFVRWKKFAWYAAAALVVGLALGVGYSTWNQNSGAQLAQVTNSSMTNTADASGDSTTANENKSATFNSTSSEETNVVQEQEVESSIEATQVEQQGQRSTTQESTELKPSLNKSRESRGLKNTPMPVNRVSTQQDVVSTEIANSKKIEATKEANVELVNSDGVTAVSEPKSTAPNGFSAAQKAVGSNASSSGEIGNVSSLMPVSSNYTVTKMQSLSAAFASSQPTLSLVSVRVPRTEVWPIHDFNVQLSAGVSAWRDFSTHRGELATDPFVRFGAERNFNRKLSLESGIEWTSISGPTARFQQTYTTYDFSYTNTITSVATNKLHYLTVPVLAKWRFKNRLQLQAGVGMSVLLAGTNTITVSEETAVTAQVTKTYNDQGYIAGFSRMNGFAQAGIQYWVGEQTAIAIGFQYGLTDITKNAYFDKAYIDRNSRLTLELKRNIL